MPSHLLIGCPTSIYPFRFPFEKSLLGPLDMVFRGQNEGLFLLSLAWACEPLAGAWVQCQGSWRFCCLRCVLTRPFLFWPHCHSLASGPLTLCSCLLLQLPPQFFKLIFSQCIFSGFICQIGFFCFYSKDPLLSKAQRGLNSLPTVSKGTRGGVRGRQVILPLLPGIQCGGKHRTRSPGIRMWTQSQQCLYLCDSVGAEQ